MKKDKKDRALVLLDMVLAVLLLVSGSMHFASSGDLSWICWMFIGICLYLRIWILTGACRRAEDEAETWRRLYRTQADVSLDLAFENEMMRKEREAGGDVK